MNIEIVEMNNHNRLVDFYMTRGIQFNEDKKYYHPPLFSYIAKVDDYFVGAITVCKENEEYILDEVALLKREKIKE